LSVLFEIATIISPLFIIAGVGFFWGRSSRPFNTNMIGGLVVNFGVPCLIFSTLTRLKVSLADFGAAAGVFSIAVLANIIVSMIILRLMKRDVGTFLPGTVFANNGNMGLPLCLFAFGPEGLALGISIFVVSATANFLLGVSFASGKMSLRETLTAPHLYVVIAALGFLFAGIDPPRWLSNTTHIIGGMSIPLMLLALGVSLARLKVSSVGQSLILAAFRIGFGFGAGLVLSWLFGLEGTARGVLILQCAMPSAVLNYIIAARFDKEPGEVAGLVISSTVLSLVTLPALLFVVIHGLN
jgi:predicted permease